jgi:hypothetical protein
MWPGGGVNSNYTLVLLGYLQPAKYPQHLNHIKIIQSIMEKHAHRLAILFTACILMFRCSTEENLNIQPGNNATESVQAGQDQFSTAVITPRLNKPCLDPGNVLNQVFHPGDELFANGQNLGNDTVASVMVLRKNGVFVSNLTFTTASPFTRGSFVVPADLEEGLYDVTIKVGNVTGNNSETFRVRF